MTELRSEFHLVPPPADGLAEAFRTAAARRRRKATTAGGAGVTAAVVVLAMLTGSSGQVLTQEPAPPAQQLPLVEVVPERPDAPAPEASAAPTTSGQVGDSVVAQAPTRTTGTAATTPPRAAAAPVSGTGPRRPAAPAYRSEPMVRDSYDVGVPLVDCNSVGSTELCSQVVRSTDRLVVVLCNQGVEPVRLDFLAADEVDVEVRSAAGVVWRWAVGRSRVSDPHQVPLPVSGCLEWTTSWKGVDQSGRPLPKGSYTLVATIDSPDAGASARAEKAFNHSP